jgi:shikimate dehydrogenase
MGAQVIQVSREAGAGHITYERLHDLDPASYQLIVNTTPLGMYPHTDAAPDVPYHLLGPAHLAFDLIYNPETTRFMQLAAQAGARTCNGYRMLVLQAEKAWEIWSQPH